MPEVIFEHLYCIIEVDHNTTQESMCICREWYIFWKSGC
jgi:hypothetical protein